MVLTIHPAQMQGMLASSEPMLLLALERLVRAHHQAVVQGLPGDLLRRMLVLACDTARQYGLTEPPQVGAFALLMFEFGPQFHRHPAVRDLLDDRALAPGQRLAAVCSRIPEAVWREIEAGLPGQTWFPGTPAEG